MAEQQHRCTAEDWRTVEKSDHLAEFSCLLELRDRIKALEARNEDDKEAWAARLRRPGRSQGERINSLVKRIEALEAAQSGSIDLSHLSDAEREKILKLLANTDRFEVLEVAQPAKPDSSLVDRVSFAICPDGQGTGFRTEARAAIRAVAAWMTSNPDHHFPPALVFALDKEAEHR